MNWTFWKNWKKKGPVGVHVDASDLEVMLQEMKDGQLSNLAKCGRFVRVEYYPGNAPAWQVSFNVTLADKAGLHYGHNGVEIVNEVGLPGGPIWNLKHIALIAVDNGQAVVKFKDCPTPPEIAALALAVEEAATEILDEYRRFKAMGRLHKAKK